jgi:hypothetical protein
VTGVVPDTDLTNSRQPGEPAVTDSLVGARVGEGWRARDEHIPLPGVAAGMSRLWSYLRGQLVVHKTSEAR